MHLRKHKRTRKVFSWSALRVPPLFNLLQHIQNMLWQCIWTQEVTLLDWWWNKKIFLPAEWANSSRTMHSSPLCEIWHQSGGWGVVTWPVAGHLTHFDSFHPAVRKQAKYRQTSQHICLTVWIITPASAPSCLCVTTGLYNLCWRSPLPKMEERSPG